MRSLFSVTVVAVSMSLSAPVMAAPLSANELLYHFTLITLGDAQSTSQVHGRAYIGGDLRVVRLPYNAHGATPSPSYDALTLPLIVSALAGIALLRCRKPAGA